MFLNAEFPVGSIRRKPTLPDTSDLPMVQAEAPRLLAGDTDFQSVVSALKSGAISPKRKDILVGV
jgi:hypothetical protein